MTTSRLLSFACSLALAATTVGCGKVSLSLDGLNPGAIFAPLSQLSSGAEFVASSQQGQKTVNSYTIDASAGSSFSQLVATTPSGYQVFSTVQGQLTSESEQVSAAAAAAAAIQ